LLLETRNILEELLGMEEVLRDKALMEPIKAGKVHTIAQLKQKLRRQGKL